MPRLPLSIPMQMTLQVAKADHGGEDAPPYVNPTTISTCDGLGGSGAVKYPEFVSLRGQSPAEPPPDLRSGAHVASRLVQAVVASHSSVTTKRAVASLRLSIEESLIGFDRAAGSPRSGLRGSNLRPLPTTLALACIERSDTSTWRAHVATAGDSRVYLLDTKLGLQQLSEDHLDRPVDALTAIRESGKMSNCVSLERDWYLDVRVYEDFCDGQLLISCSDGCFDYVWSPMHLEHILLTALGHSSSVDEWSLRLQDYFGRTSQDDATMAMLCLGNTTFEQVRESFRDRYRQIHATVTGLEPSEVGLRPEGWEDDLRTAWESYERTYMGCTPTQDYRMNAKEARQLLNSEQRGTTNVDTTSG